MCYMLIRISITFIEHFLFRWYEELQCKEVDEEIKQRLQTGEEITLSNGKLLDRLLVLKMIRENIPKRASFWTRRQKRDPDPTKATFIYDLIPIAESRLENIKYVILFLFLINTNLPTLPLPNAFQNENRNISAA